MRFSLRGKEIQVADWREEEHPRDEDGKFTDKGGKKVSSIDRIRRIIEERKLGKKVAQNTNQHYNNIKLDKVVWAKFYNKVAEIQHGGAYEKTRSSNIRITIEHEGTFYTILYNGDFENPKILQVNKYKDQ